MTAATSGLRIRGIDHRFPRPVPAVLLLALARRYRAERLIRRVITEPAYEFELRRGKRIRSPIAVGALVRNVRGRVLLVRPTPGTGWPENCWMAPGGKVEADESIEHALARELLEETGVRGTIRRLPKLFENIYTDGNDYVPHYWFQFEVLAEDGPLRPSARDVCEARWFEELPATMMWRDDYADLLPAPARSGRSR